MWLGSTYSTAPSSASSLTCCMLILPFSASCRWLDTEVQDTPLVQASSTNSSRQTTCRTSSVHTNSAWKAIRPFLTNTFPRCGPHPIIAIVAATRRVFSKWGLVGVCTLTCLKRRRRTSEMDRIIRRRRVRVVRCVIDVWLGFRGGRCDFAHLPSISLLSLTPRIC